MAQSYTAMTIEQLERQLTFLGCPLRAGDGQQVALMKQADPLSSALAAALPNEESPNVESPRDETRDEVQADALACGASSAWTRYTQSRLRQFGSQFGGG